MKNDKVDEILVNYHDKIAKFNWDYHDKGQLDEYFKLVKENIIPNTKSALYEAIEEKMPKKASPREIQIAPSPQFERGRNQTIDDVLSAIKEMFE